MVRLSSSFELSCGGFGEDRLAIFKTFWHPLGRLIPRCWLGFVLDGVDFPVFSGNFGASFARLWLDGISYLSWGRSVRRSWRSGEVFGFAQVFSCGSLWFFWLSSLGSCRRPVAGLGFGVLLVQLWVCGSAAVSAAPLVVPVPPSFFLRLYLNRLSTERKQFARRCPYAGVGQGFLFPSLTGAD